MQEKFEEIQRPVVPEIEAILGKPFSVLDDGFVRVVDYMGSDESIVQAARVSYGRGTKKRHQDRGLIRYLMRHQHTTPFEMCEIKLHVRVPMDTWRQWIRHRTACLAGDTVLSFDEPHAIRSGHRKHRGKTLKEIFEQWHGRATQTVGKKKKPLFLERIDPKKEYTVPELAQLVERRPEDLRNVIRSGKLAARRVTPSDPRKPQLFVKGAAWIDYATASFKTSVRLQPKIRQMHLRMCDEETGEILHTHITDIWESGVKPVFKVTLKNGYTLKMSKDHLCLTEQGWLTLEQATGLKLSKNGNVSWKADAPAFAVNGIPMYRSKEWLSQQRERGLGIREMAAAAGVSYHTIRKWLKVHHLQFSEQEKATIRAALLRGRRRASKKRGPLTGLALAKVRMARSGANSNFWKGGVSTERENIGRWTTEHAQYVHSLWNFQCAICGSKENLEAHHIDPVWNNPEKATDLNNLISLCQKCHTQIHRNNLEIDFLNWHLQKENLKDFWAHHPTKKPRPEKKKRPTPTRLYRYFSEIEKIEYVGEEMTYDVEVSGPYHNFVANGFIVHNSVNEYSTRYSIAIDAAYETSPDAWRLQATVNRQGSEGFLDAQQGSKMSEREKELHRLSREIYEERLQAGVAREQARKDLPLCTYTEAYWKIDLHNLLHFLKLRMESHAQYEIRQYATIIGEQIVKRWVPLAWEAFQDYILNAEHFSRHELQILSVLYQGDKNKAVELAREFGWITYKDGKLTGNIERLEFEAKLKALQIEIPWK